MQEADSGVRIRYDVPDNYEPLKGEDSKRFKTIVEQLEEEDLTGKKWTRWLTAGLGVATFAALFVWLGFVVYAIPNLDDWNIVGNAQVALITTAGLNPIAVEIVKPLFRRLVERGN